MCLSFMLSTLLEGGPCGAAASGREPRAPTIKSVTSRVWGHLVLAPQPSKSTFHVECMIVMVLEMQQKAREAATRTQEQGRGLSPSWGGGARAQL